MADPIHQFEIHKIFSLGHIGNQEIAFTNSSAYMLGAVGVVSLLMLGMKFFPFVFSLFMFILTANLIGIVPFTFTVTSHLIVTLALALMVFLTVLGYGLYKNGLGFFRLFVPSGIPMYILPLIVVIEVISFLSRPVSHSVRLFANMLAGHITLKVFAGFVTSLSALGALGIAGSLLPLAMTTALTALELLVAFLQAYVFTILTCIYLNDALHPGH
jgi:F-type H+-transporting ATPase subunit a